MSQDSEKELSQFKKNADASEELLDALNQIDAGCDEEIEAEAQRKKEERQNSGAKGFAAASHVVSGILVGLGIGYGLDVVAGTEPWGLVIFIPIGFIAGMINMVRSLD